MSAMLFLGLVQLAQAFIVALGFLLLTRDALAFLFARLQIVF
jgi:hypothetical protein